MIRSVLLLHVLLLPFLHPVVSDASQVTSHQSKSQHSSSKTDTSLGLINDIVTSSTSSKLITTLQQQISIDNDVNNGRSLQITDDDNTDDRHGKKPEEETASNGPAEFFTKMPSLQPSTYPTITPTLRPSFSIAPTAYDPCSKHHEFDFGLYDWDNDENILTVKYNYDIETDMEIANAMGATLIDETKAIESALLDMLTRFYFPQCNNIRKLKHNIFAPGLFINNTDADILTKNSMTSNQTNVSKLIGMSSRPFDFANGGKCNNEVCETCFFIILLHNPTSNTWKSSFSFSLLPETCEVKSQGSNDHIACLIMEGRMSLFYAHPVDPTLSRSRNLDETTPNEGEFLSSIKAIMDDGALNNCHPAIVNVKFRSRFDNSNFTYGDDDQSDGDDEVITVPLTGPDATMWMVIGASAGLFIMFLTTRYRYYRNEISLHKNTQTETGSHSSDDAFVEFGGGNKDNFDLVSSLSMPMQVTKHDKRSLSSRRIE